MNWFLDVFAEDYSDANLNTLASIRRLQEDERSGPCDDDCEVTCPFVDMLPDESDHENGSPLKF